MSDPLLVDCPSCGAATFRKQVTAAGFQLKGSGWYVTDFRNPASKEAPKGGKSDGDAAPAPASTDSGSPATGGSEAPKAAPAPATTPAPAPAPAARSESGGSKAGPSSSNSG